MCSRHAGRNTGGARGGRAGRGRARAGRAGRYKQGGFASQTQTQARQGGCAFPNTNTGEERAGKTLTHAAGGGAAGKRCAQCTTRGAETVF